MRLSWGDYTCKIVSITLAQPAGATSIITMLNPSKPAAYLRPRSNIKCNIKPTDLFPTTHSFFCNSCNKICSQNSALRSISQELVYSAGWGLCEPVNWRKQRQFELQPRRGWLYYTISFCSCKIIWSQWSHSNFTDVYNQAAAFSNHIPVRAAFYVEVSSVLKILPMVSMSYLAVMPTTDLGMAKFHSVRNCQKACSLISRCGEGLALNYVLNDLKFFVHLWMHTKLHSACATK